MDKLNNQLLIGIGIGAVIVVLYYKQILKTAKDETQIATDKVGRYQAKYQKLEEVENKYNVDVNILINDMLNMIGL